MVYCYTLCYSILFYSTSLYSMTLRYSSTVYILSHIIPYHLIILYYEITIEYTILAPTSKSSMPHRYARVLALCPHRDSIRQAQSITNTLYGMHSQWSKVPVCTWCGCVCAWGRGMMKGERSWRECDV
jgi:hypothetical protein